MSYLNKSYFLSAESNRGLEKFEFHVIINHRREEENARIKLCVRESNGGKETIHTEAGRVGNLFAHAEQYDAKSKRMGRRTCPSYDWIINREITLKNID
jgi:hypothetical protein